MLDRFAAAYAAQSAAHQVADHWVQTQHQSNTKGLPGWTGRLNCAKHVATYTATAAVALAAVALVDNRRPPLRRVAAGLAVSAITHYIADRRTPLLRIAEALSKIGKDDFYRVGFPRPGHDDNPSIGTGAYALDQSWHYAWIFVASLIIASGPERKEP
jgi:hypothetical protein